MAFPRTKLRLAIDEAFGAPAVRRAERAAVPPVRKSVVDMVCDDLVFLLSVNWMFLRSRVYLIYQRC